MQFVLLLQIVKIYHNECLQLILRVFVMRNNQKTWFKCMEFYIETGVTENNCVCVGVLDKLKL